MNAKNIVFKKFNISGGLSFSFFEIFDFIKMFQFVKKNNIDIIRTSSPKFGVLGLLLAYLLNTKIVYMVSGVGFLGVSNNIVIKFLYYFIKKLEIFLLKRTKSFVLTENSNDYKYWTKKMSKERVKILCGAGVSNIYYDKYNSKKDKRVLFPSRFLISKGAQIFIEAANILKIKYPDWEFTMIGSDDYNNPHLIKKEILEKAKKNK